jgi:hypothetical protein
MCTTTCCRVQTVNVRKEYTQILFNRVCGRLETLSLKNLRHFCHFYECFGSINSAWNNSLFRKLYRTRHEVIMWSSWCSAFLKNLIAFRSVWCSGFVYSYCTKMRFISPVEFTPASLFHFKTLPCRPGKKRFSSFWLRRSNNWSWNTS